jgi:hypothetical protein
LAPYGAFPQGLKPSIFLLRGGTAEAVPFQNRVMKQLLAFSILLFTETMLQSGIRYGECHFQCHQF